MVWETPNASLRWLALAATVAAIALVAGCGEDGSAESTAPGASPEQAGTEQSDADAESVESFGEEANPGDRDAAATTVQGFLRAQADGDWAKACSLMSAATQQGLEAFASQSVKSQRCPPLVEAMTARIPPKTLPRAEQIQVGGVRVEGERGFVLYRDGRGTRSAFSVVREGSAWKVAAIAGYRVP
jgi:hypothetical protein